VAETPPDKCASQGYVAARKLYCFFAGPAFLRHPAVVLFHGSGLQKRDLITARWFAAEGIAALAYDKRGVGESGGDFRMVPFMELCDDGLGAIKYLKSRKEIDAKRIGVWGLSQGGWLGPRAASRSADVAFVIAVSGPVTGRTDDRLLRE